MNRKLNNLYNYVCEEPISGRLTRFDMLVSFGELLRAIAEMEQVHYHTCRNEGINIHGGPRLAYAKTFWEVLTFFQLSFTLPLDDEDTKSIEAGWMHKQLIDPKKEEGKVKWDLPTAPVETGTMVF